MPIIKNRNADSCSVLMKYKDIFDHSIDALFISTPSGELLLGNQPLAEIFGYGSFEEMRQSGINLKDHLFDSADKFSALADQLSQHGSIRYFEAFANRKNLELFWININSRLLHDFEDYPTVIQGSIQNITPYKAIESETTHTDYHDPLTGLYNRNMFLTFLNKASARSRRHKSFSFALICLDIDRFRIINESLGHESGDMIITKLAIRLSNSLRTEDICARLVGDEFGILVNDVSGIMDPIRVIERVNNSLKAPLTIKGTDIFASVSSGILIDTHDYMKSEDMLRDAETAMHRAKASPSCSFAIFNEKMQKEALNRLHLETHLRKALDQNEFRIFYQPIVSFKTQRIIAFEALLRWQHPSTGLIMPFSFIPLLEETGLIIPVGDWVLEQSCRQTHQWQKEFGLENQLMISVNVSARQLSKTDFIKDICSVLETSGLPPSSLKLEITESVIMEQSHLTETTLSHLKSLGICLSIDDFGTGYSSLAYLNRFPMDILKVDKSFVEKIDGRNQGCEIIEAIISLSHHLNKEVVVEGVETVQHFEQLKKFHCDYGQGYYFSKPLCEQDAGNLLRNGLPLR